MQDLRTPARLSPQVRYLPYLLQRACIQGSDPRRKKSKLVSCNTAITAAGAVTALLPQRSKTAENAPILSEGNKLVSAAGMLPCRAQDRENRVFGACLTTDQPPAKARQQGKKRQGKKPTLSNFNLHKEEKQCKFQMSSQIC